MSDRQGGADRDPENDPADDLPLGTLGAEDSDDEEDLVLDDEDDEDDDIEFDDDEDLEDDEE